MVILPQREGLHSLSSSSYHVASDETCQVIVRHSDRRNLVYLMCQSVDVDALVTRVASVMNTVFLPIGDMKVWVTLFSPAVVVCVWSVI